MVKIKNVKKNFQTRSAFFDLFFASRKGMSFVELIAVIAIIGIGSSIAIVSLTPARTQAKLKAAQTELAANIKLVQSYALQGKMESGVTPKAFGLGMSINNAYQLYYCPNTVACPDTEKMQIESISLDGSGVNFINGQFVTFSVPHGNPTLSSGSSNLVIELNYPGETPKTVTVTSGGSIIEN
jgi:prepilin-type N-terminal cleavage/methylation domain-containing protein